jgi:deoxyadenosine/deoxycytidine kinase
MTPTFLRTLWLDMRREKLKEILANRERDGENRFQKKKEALAELHRAVTAHIDSFQPQG